MNVTSTCRANSETKILLSKGMICGALEMFSKKKEQTNKQKKNVVSLTAWLGMKKKKKDYKTRFVELVMRFLVIYLTFV